MKRCALLVAVTAALALAGAAPAAPAVKTGLPGTYTTKIASPARYKGTWTLTFTKAKAYAVAFKGQTLVLGRWSATGARVTLSREKGPLSCGFPGVYTWKRSGRALQLTKVRDSQAACAGRAVVLAHAFRLA
jgi:hypothetical protein